MKPTIQKDLKDLLLTGLKDDGFGLDWTTLGTSSVKNRQSLTAVISAKACGVFLGETLALAAEAASVEIGLPFKVRALSSDGQAVKPGTKVSEWKGSAAGILALERPYLNLASYLSGIATRTRVLVDTVESEWKRKKHSGIAPRVTSTRKILPHYRDAAISAVMAGGGFAHRVSLSGGVLIKENHIAAAGSIRDAVEGARSVAPHGLKIEVEVRNLSELKQALHCKVEIIMLDNFTPSEVGKAVASIASFDYSPLVECSGGISEKTIAAYALPGVHILSIGGLTHSVTALDLSLLVK
ncbi:MAG: carboxylating nicotinate-nucleotide diphosphorylase [Cryobacterium sp.]|nr:carboxylating nicotinate-nucleotide diphosphorylase [Oligoflexia bacterium]